LLPALALPLALSQLSACTCDTSGGESKALAARTPGPLFYKLDAPAGFIDGGLGYVAFKPGSLQTFAQQLPEPLFARGDVAEAGEELGIDLRTGDVISHLGLDPEGVISMTIGRPLLGEGDGDRLFDELAHLSLAQPGDLPPELTRRLGAVGVHARVHVPIISIEPFLNGSKTLLRGLKLQSPDLDLDAPICAELQPNVLCAGDEEGLVVVREIDTALVADLFLYPAGVGSISDPERRPAIDAALKIDRGEAPVTLRGDLAGYVDATRLRDVATVYLLSEVASPERWASEEGGARWVEGRREELKRIDRLRATRLLLRGMRFEAAFPDEAIRWGYTWEPTDAQAAKTLDKLLSHDSLKLDAPSIDGLCTDSLMCFRVGGLPSTQALSELATGIYAAPAGEFFEVMWGDEGLGGWVVLLETWPNLLGAANTWSQEAEGLQKAMVGQIMNALDNFAGAGGALRSLRAPEGGPATADFVAYARVSGAELGIVRGLMALASQRFTPAELSDVRGKVEALAVQDQALAASLYLITDEKTVRVEDRDLEVGWVAAADSADRLSWLMGLDRESAIEPAIYFEIPDLPRLLAKVPGIDQEIGPFEAWFRGRTVRFAAEVVDGRPATGWYIGRVKRTTPAE